MNWYHPYNASERQKTYEKNTQPSETIPDQTLTVKEIYDRFVRGLPIDGQRVPIYDGDENDFPDLSKMDLTERAETIESFRNELKEKTQKIKAKKPQVTEEDTSAPNSL